MVLQNMCIDGNVALDEDVDDMNIGDVANVPNEDED